MVAAPISPHFRGAPVRLIRVSVDGLVHVSRVQLISLNLLRGSSAWQTLPG